METMVVADLLVVDRLADFQKLAMSKGLLNADGTAPSNTDGKKIKKEPSLKAPVQKSAVMREFFEKVNEIQTILNKGRGNVKQMGGVLEEALQATTQDRQRTVSDQLADLVQETNQHILSVKLKLEELKKVSDEEERLHPNGAECSIRKNMHTAMVKKHQDLLVEFQKAQLDFKHGLEQRETREMQMVIPDASEEDVREMIDEGDNASLLLARKMAGTHAVLIDEVNRIRDKHQDILRLERSMADLAQMFQEVAVLVDAQGEMLDVIEMHVQKANVYTAKAEQNLITTRKTQKKNQRCMCWITVIMLVVLLVILGPVLVTQS